MQEGNATNKQSRANAITTAIAIIEPIIGKVSLKFYMPNLWVNSMYYESTFNLVAADMRYFI